VRNVRHDGGAQAERARLDRREQDRVVVSLPQDVAAAPQGLELCMRELRAELALPRSSS